MSRAIAVDLDGCVANFTHGFSSLCHSFTEEAPIVMQSEAKSWRWQDWYWDAGPDAAQIIEDAWRHIKKSSTFWLNLPVLFPQTMPEVAALARAQPLVFVTRRDGAGVWLQTTRWLQERGVEEPLVYCVQSGEEKEDVLTKLGIRVIIEDSPVYAEGLKAAGHEVVLIDWPYNRQTKGVHRVDNLHDALIVAKDIADVDRS